MNNKELSIEDSFEITIFNNASFDTKEMFSDIANLVHAKLPDAQICGGRPLVKDLMKANDKVNNLAKKVKNLPQTYGEKGLGKVYDIAINDVLNLLK